MLIICFSSGTLCSTVFDHHPWVTGYIRKVQKSSNGCLNFPVRERWAVTNVTACDEPANRNSYGNYLSSKHRTLPNSWVCVRRLPVRQCLSFGLACSDNMQLPEPQTLPPSFSPQDSREWKTPATAPGASTAFITPVTMMMTRWWTLQEPHLTSPPRTTSLR